MCEGNKRKGYGTIKQVLRNNKYDVKILDKITPTSDAKTQERKEEEKTKQTQPNGSNLRMSDDKPD
jgi:hypothetical protein